MKIKPINSKKKLVTLKRILGIRSNNCTNAKAFIIFTNSFDFFVGGGTESPGKQYIAIFFLMLLRFQN